MKWSILEIFPLNLKAKNIFFVQGEPIEFFAILLLKYDSPGIEYLLSLIIGFCGLNLRHGNFGERRGFSNISILIDIS
jgi:hypothetical protein